MADTVSSKKIDGEESNQGSRAERGVQVCSRCMKWGATQPKPSIYYKGGMPSAKSTLKSLEQSKS